MAKKNLPLDANGQDVPPESRPGGTEPAGRFLRPVVRAAALVVGVFALGLLAGYLLLYQPLAAQAQRTAAALETTTARLAENEKTLTAVRSDQAALEQKLKTANTGLETAANQITLLKVSGDVGAARLALLDRNGAEARQRLLTGRTGLEKLKPSLPANAEVLKAMTARLDLVLAELVRDPAAAQVDLGLLAADLDKLEREIFK